jgi:hypothetical protein
MKNIDIFFEDAVLPDIYQSANEIWYKCSKFCLAVLTLLVLFLTIRVKHFMTKYLHQFSSKQPSLVLASTSRNVTKEEEGFFTDIG